MELLSNKGRNSLVAVALSATALYGCSIDSYLTDPSNVQCDGKRTMVNLEGDGMATFIVHGEHDGNIATVKVRREDNDASVSVRGDTAGSPQQFEADGFTKPTPVTNGAELSAVGAGGAWVIDVRNDTVVIQGSCDGS